MENKFSKITEKDWNCIKGYIIDYAKIHDTALYCGGEYIWQDDSAQVDSIDLVSNIFNYMSENIFFDGEE